MADRYWIASSAANWNDTANWSATSGGAGGETVPTYPDDVYFDANGTGNCTININAGCLSLTLGVGYNGTVSVATGKDLYCTNNLSVNSGSTFEIVDSDVISFSGVLVCDGVITGNTTLLISDNETSSLAAGTYDVPIEVRVGNNKNLVFLGDCVFNKDIAINNVRAGGIGTIDCATNNPNLEFKGSVSLGGSYVTNTVWSKGTGTLTFSSTANQSIDVNGEAVEDIDIDKTAGTVTLAADVDPDSLTITQGTLDIDGYTVTTVGNVVMAAGTSVADTAATGTFSIGGILDINGTSGTGCTWTDADISALAAGSNVAEYCTVSNSTNSSGNAIDATLGCTDSGGNTGWTFGGSPPVPTSVSYWGMLTTVTP